MTLKIVKSPEELAKARHLYEQTLAPVADIADMLGVSDSWLYLVIKNENWQRRKAHRGAFNFAQALADAAAQPVNAFAVPAFVERVDPEVLESARVNLAFRLYCLLQNHFAAVDRVLGAVNPASGGEADRGSRTMEALSRAICEVAALLRPQQPTSAAEKTDSDDIPVDLDRLRDELGRRLYALVEADRAQSRLSDQSDRPIHSGDEAGRT